MENKYYLIDTSGLGEIGAALVNRVADIGLAFINRDTPSKMADKAFADEIIKSDLSAFEKHALISNMKRLTKEFSNQQDVLKIALDHLNESARPSDVDETFLAQIMDKARFAYSEDFKIIWGKILAEECNEPNSIPKTLLFILEQMDKDDAQSFINLCSCVVKLTNIDDECYTPIIHDFVGTTYWETLISYDSLLQLETLGLINTELGSFKHGKDIEMKNGCVKASYFDQTYSFPVNMNVIPVDRVVFTKSGEALCRLIEAPKLDSYFETQCVTFWDAVIVNRNKADE